MPRIPEYTNPVTGIDTRGLDEASYSMSYAARARANAGEQIGRDIAGIGASIGRTYDAVADSIDENRATAEISAGSAASAAMQAKMSADLNQRVNEADPNVAPQVIDDFLNNEVDTRLTEFRDSFTTKKGKEYADRVSASMRQHFFERAAADKAIKAGQAFKQNFNTLGNQLSVASKEDPTSLTMNLGMVDTTFDAMVQANARWLTPSMLAALEGDRATVKREVTLSAMAGMAEINPEQAQKDYYKMGAVSQYLDGNDLRVMEGYARQRQADRDQDTAAREKALEKQQKAVVDQELIRLELSMIDENGRITVPPDFAKRLTDIAMMPGAEVSGIRTIKNGYEAILKDQINGNYRASDPLQYEALRRNLNAGTLTKDQVFQARAANLLSDSDTSMFSQAADALNNEGPEGRQQEKLFNEFLEGQKKYISATDPLKVVQDPAGDFRFMEFSQDMRVRYQKGLAAGKNPYDLLMPRSPDFIGRDIGRYQIRTDFKKTLENIKGSPTPPAPVPDATQPGAVPVQDNTRREGESAADFLKRTGGK
jgi:hypothetical protein